MELSNWIVSAEAADISNSQIGGKAKNLLRLSKAGFEVPPFFVIAADAFRAQLATNDDLRLKIAQLTTLQNAALRTAIDVIQSQVASLELLPACKNSIENALRNSIPVNSFVAVRSSASDEDGTDHSFAGMHDSFLFLKSVEDIIVKVKQVWASAFNERAIAYRREHGLEITKIAVAVVIQQMIDAKTSGVIFTCNPANDRTNQVVISSLFGAGEGLVSGGLAADTYTVYKSTAEFASDIVDKESQLVFDNQLQAGLKQIGVESKSRNQTSLSDDQVKQVAKVAGKIERYFGKPQDIEFCFDQTGKLFILQARPITRVQQYGPAAGNRLVWDNSNIIESYSGVTSPMTFSFIRRAYTIVYHCFAEVMGIPSKQVKASRHVFENMLGLFRGRVYYNLQNWYRLIHLFPGFQYNTKFMESMMGLKDPLVLDESVSKPGFFRRWFVELPALLRLVWSTSWNFLRIGKIVSQFQTHFHEHYDRWDAMDFDQLAPHELRGLYHEMEDALLWNWKAPIINDFYVMIYYGLLKRLCEKWVGDQSGALQNDLICGEGGIESAEPAKMLLSMAGKAWENAELREQIFSEPLEQVPARINSDSRFAEFSQQMRRYLKLYGFRCMNELKLEEFSLRDKPHMVYQVLRNYLSLDDRAALDVDAMHTREQSIRHEAESRAMSAIKGFRLLPRKLMFRRVLRNARMGVKNRENMRFARTRIYGIVRELLRSMGQRMAYEKILPDREDIFYLTIDEVWDFIKGTAVTTRLAELASLRKAEFDAYRDQPAPDDRFETFGFAYHKNLLINENEQLVETGDGELRGIGCCPGELINVVRVLRTPQDDLSLSGEILVAERTDPGWVPLYPAVSGILIERGSILSHSAVVAREMGIPTIVGINGLLKKVKDGDTVKMNGGSGLVELMESENEDDSQS